MAIDEIRGSGSEEQGRTGQVLCGSPSLGRNLGDDEAVKEMSLKAILAPACAYALAMANPIP